MTNHIDRNLIEAFTRIAKRKRVISDAQDGEGNRFVGVKMDPETTTMFSGTDLKSEEIMALAEKMARTGMAAILLDEIDTPGALIGIYVDGFLVGLELGKIRTEQALAEAKTHE